MRWAAKQRGGFIRSAVERGEPLNRSDLAKEYGVSTQTAAADFANYRALFPGTLEYDTSLKCYVPVTNHIEGGAIMSDKVTIEAVRSVLCSVAAELIAGKWMSPFREDNPKAIPAKTLREIERDEGHRVNLSLKLKRIYDQLGALSDSKAQEGK